jgi:hypothetical protein
MYWDTWHKHMLLMHHLSYHVKDTYIGMISLRTCELVVLAVGVRQQAWADVVPRLVVAQEGVRVLHLQIRHRHHESQHTTAQTANNQVVSMPSLEPPCAWCMYRHTHV